MTFLTTTADQKAAFENPGTKIAARVSMAFQMPFTYVVIPDETIISISLNDELETDTAGAIVSTATIKLDNEQLWYSPLRASGYNPINHDYNGPIYFGDTLGNLRPGVPVKIEVNPGGTGWITRFEGYVDDRGFQEKIFSGTRNEVTVRCEDLFARLKYVETAPDGGDTRVYTSVKVFDAADELNSLVHILADLAGISSSNVSGETISHVIDYAPLTGSVAEELAKLAEAWQATFTVVNGVIYFTDSRYADAYVETTLWQFSFDNDVYSEITSTINRAEVKNEVETSYKHYAFLEKQPLWQFSEGLNPDTGKTNYLIPVGDETKNITNPGVTYQAKYSIPINNEPYSVVYAQNIDDAATTLAAADIEGAGTATFAEYDVSTYGDRAIIRLAVAGDDVTIKNLVIKGEGLVNTRVNKHLERSTGSINEIGARRMKKENKFFTEADIDGYPHYASWAKWHLDYYSKPRFKFSVKTDRPLLNATVGSLVIIRENLNGTLIFEICKIIGIKANLSGDKTSMTFTAKSIMQSWAGTPASITNVDQTTFEASATGATAAAQAAYGLNEYGAVQLPVSNVNILEEIQAGALSGLYFDMNRFGFYDGTDWNTFFDSAGDARIGIAGGNRIDWDQSTGFLSVHGDMFLSGDSTIQGSITTGSSIIAGGVNGVEISASGWVQAGTGDTIVRMDSADLNWRLWAGAADAATAPFRVSTTGAVYATDLTITGGSITLGSNFSVSDTGVITAASGTIGGWTIDGSLKSDTGAARLELDPTNNRMSVIASYGTKVAMGYLGGLQKGDGSGYWASTDYGFWAATGDTLRIDGDMEYISGDWIINNDASIRFYDSNPLERIRIGSEAGVQGMHFYNGSGLAAVSFTPYLYSTNPYGLMISGTYPRLGIGVEPVGAYSLVTAAPIKVGGSIYCNDSGAAVWADYHRTQTIVNDINGDPIGSYGTYIRSTDIFIGQTIQAPSGSKTTSIRMYSSDAYYVKLSTTTGGELDIWARVNVTWWLDAAELLEGGVSLVDKYTLIGHTHASVSDILDLSTNLANLTDAEVTQLEAIGLNAISSTNWGRLAAIDQNLTSYSGVQFGTVSLTSTGGWYSHEATRQLLKYSLVDVATSADYAIGLVEDYTYGSLVTGNEVMTFTMPNAATSGWLWRDADDAATDGAASLTTGGHLTVRGSILAGGGIEATGLITGATFSSLIPAAGTNTLGDESNPWASLHVDSIKLNGIDIVTSGGTDASAWAELSDGTLICWGGTSPTTVTETNRNTGTYGWSYWSASQSITFAKTFSTAPAVFATGHHISYTATSITTTGFTLGTIHYTGSQGPMHWLAIGKSA